MINNQNTLLNMVADQLSNGVVLTAQNSSVLFNMIPFIEVKSNSYSYNVVDELMNVAFREIGQEAGVSCISPIKVTEVLKIMNSDVLTDRALTLYQNINEIRSEQTTVAVSSMMDEYEKQFFYGDGFNASFKGLYPRLEDGVGKFFEGVITGTKSNIESELELLDSAMDYVKEVREGNGAIFCNNKTKRNLNKLMRSSGNLLSNVELFGKSVKAYDGVPIISSEAIADGDIFIIKFDEAMGVSGLTCGGLIAKDLGLLGTNYRTMVEMLTAIAVKHPRSFAIIGQKRT